METVIKRKVLFRNYQTGEYVGSESWEYSDTLGWRIASSSDWIPNEVGVIVHSSEYIGKTTEGGAIKW
jgi:hypothetical protein